MGYIKHHAILVTSWDTDKLELAHKKAIDIFSNTVSWIVDSKINDYKSFFIAPDGSKEGWQESDEGDTKREMFIRYINSLSYEDGSNSVSFCELYYGEDNHKSEIVNHN